MRIMFRLPLLLGVLSIAPLHGETITVVGLKQPAEILRDRWGVPHIYAANTHDLFFAQGYITARDRLFQVDLWRRINTGALAEVMGPRALGRDRIARLVRFRGDWAQEWTSYAPDTREIVAAFAAGINENIRSRKGNYPVEFRLAGYAPGQWAPEDCLARIAGLLMTRNVTRELDRALDIREYGLETMMAVRPPDPFIRLTIPGGLDLKVLTADILRDYSAAIGGARVDVDQGSNNWVVDGTMSYSGKPLLANDPHRPINIPSLRKTVHLVSPGWNVIGAGEPALPGIALGHNEEVGFGFTIVGIDQGDLYVERTNPANRDEYRYRGAWRKMEVVRERIPVKGQPPQTVELRYTIHGPVVYEDRPNHRAYALKSVVLEPGGAGYLAALSLSRARNWAEFRKAAERYKVPSENLVYADRAGNIGWIASGWAPVRKNWSGLLPVPGDTGEYEWSGYLPLDQHPQEFNPPRHYIATANHNILPQGYAHALSYEWAAPFRYQRVVEMLAEKRKFTVADFERMQQDVVSLPARRFQQILKRHEGSFQGALGENARLLLKWDAQMLPDRIEPTLFSVWLNHVPKFLMETPAAGRMDAVTTLKLLEKKRDGAALGKALRSALDELEQGLGKDRAQWTWGRLHTLRFEHPLRVTQREAAKFHRGPVPRPGDGNTVNAASGSNYRQSNGASYRQILDLADWDRSVMTNVPGESGDPESPYYSNLLDDWNAGRYHPMPYTRQAVEKSMAERIHLKPAPAK
jgi:penicillin amidase